MEVLVIINHSLSMDLSPSEQVKSDDGVGVDR